MTSRSRPSRAISNASSRRPGSNGSPCLACRKVPALSIAYAVRYPDRVSHLIICGGYARGRRKRGSPDDAAQSEAIITLMRQGWGRDNPAFRQIFTSLFIPGGTAEQMQWFNDLQRITTSPDNAVRIRVVIFFFFKGRYRRDGTYCPR